MDEVPEAWRTISLFSARLNGINMRWADTGGDGPTVLFLHGWPESWFSWRHQLLAVRASGFRGIAPDMRGFGGTDAPANFAEYSISVIAADMSALLLHLGLSGVALVGHDHGANVGWKLALLHPDTFRCYCALSVPYSGRPAAPPIQRLRSKFGDEREPAGAPSSHQNHPTLPAHACLSPLPSISPEGKQLFNYQLHHQMRDAATAYDRDPRGALLALFQDAEGEARPPPVVSKLLWVDGEAEPLWRRLPQPDAPPQWMAPADFRYLVSTFRRGFEGGLNWYRVMDRDWHKTAHLAGCRLSQPIAFIGGLADQITRWFGGPDAVRAALKRECDLDPEVHFLAASHWIQQELPGKVSQILLDFLERHRSWLPQWEYGDEGPAASHAPRPRL